MQIHIFKKVLQVACAKGKTVTKSSKTDQHGTQSIPKAAKINKGDKVYQKAINKTQKNDDRERSVPGRLQYDSGETTDRFLSRSRCRKGGSGERSRCQHSSKNIVKTGSKQNRENHPQSYFLKRENM